MLYTDDSRGFACAEDPEVVEFRGRYFLYYVLAPGEGGHRLPWHIGIAVSDDLERFEKVGELAPADLGETNGVCVGSLVVVGERLHLFYFTYGSGPNDAICHAVSDDGVRFVPHPRNPVFRASGGWNCGRAISPSVVRDGDRLRMYACTRCPDMARQSIVLAEAPLASDLGPEHWHQLGNAEVFGPELGWEHESTESPSLIHHEGRWFMFYGGGYWTRPQQIGCAVSVDGIRWQRLSDQPLLAYRDALGGPPLERASPAVFRDRDGGHHLLFQESSDRGRSWRVRSYPISWHDGAPRLG
jgi:hypothetical protein